MLALAVTKLPDQGGARSHELKFDGYRTRA